MKKELEKIKKEFKKNLEAVSDFLGLERLEQDFFGRKSGSMSELMKGIKDMSEEKRKELGKLLNEMKQEFESLIEEKKSGLDKAKFETLGKTESIDVTQTPLDGAPRGHIHPVTQALYDMEEIARAMGFIVEDGPELESDYFNFEALNIPAHHPARDSQDTFYIRGNPRLCMRSHVSNMQVRLMRKYNNGGNEAVRAAYPGRVFRNEATDASHEHTFYQFEALVVDRNITLGHLIGIIKEFLRGLYKKEVRVRVRPSYFPFTEPSLEFDMACLLCKGAGCPACGKTGWVEILGGGLMHPNVVKEGGYDPREWQGMAFGMGLTRLAMMKYGIEDIRHLQSGDLRFLNQF